MKRSESGSMDIFGFDLKGWVRATKITDKKSLKQDGTGRVVYLGGQDSQNLKSALKDHLLPWQIEHLMKNGGETAHLTGKYGPVWILRPAQDADKGRPDLLTKSKYARARDQVGAVVSQMHSYGLRDLCVEFHDSQKDEEIGGLIGLELASYSYSENRSQAPKRRKKFPQLHIRKDLTGLEKADIESCAVTGAAINLARHLVNVPPVELHPESYSEVLQKLFSKSATVRVDVWKKPRLEKENMRLLLAVGNSGRFGPCLVHLRYRPRKSTKKRPVAFVGKGVTFDSGGLDIKPSSGMRLMKKDMGGSAAVAALCYWVEQSGLDVPCDFYLSLAENAVDQNSFHPGDIVTSRNGLTVEIHNTDAEGRLVLADALDVAVTQTGVNEPSTVIDVATLTGAIKVGLGSEIAGLFSNDDELSELIHASGHETGDLNWRMPLYQPYRNSLRSSFADVSNATDGFGGAITAALFLESFVANKPWAHLDIYAWRDSTGGAFTEAGGSGQAVQCLSSFLKKLEFGE